MNPTTTLSIVLPVVNIVLFFLFVLQPQQQHPYYNYCNNFWYYSNAITTATTGTLVAVAFPIVPVFVGRLRRHNKNYQQAHRQHQLPLQLPYRQRNHMNDQFSKPQPRLVRHLVSKTASSHTENINNNNNNYIDNHDGVIHEVNVPLPNGITMQVICGIPRKNLITQQQQLLPPVLLLLHGSFHSAWCYQEHYIPYFISNTTGSSNNCNHHTDYITIAPSWRGTAGTPLPPQLPAITNQYRNRQKVKMNEHVEDLQYLMTSIPAIIQYVMTSYRSTDSNSTSNCRTNSTMSPWSQEISTIPTLSSPIRLYVICHSFGGIVLMKYLEKYYPANRGSRSTCSMLMSGIIMMCSIPPSGNGKMTLRFLRRSIQQSYDITIGFAMKRCCTDIQLCRKLFFDTDMDDTTIERYQSYFTRDSKITIDLLDLAKQLPSKYIRKLDSSTSVKTNSGGTAVFVDESFPSCLVIGANDDYIVDYEALLETSQYFNCYTNSKNGGNIDSLGSDDRMLKTNTAQQRSQFQTPQVTLIDSTHDVMLGSKWMNGATTIVQWIQHQETLIAQ